MVLQVTTLCSLGGRYHYFEGNWCLHLQGRNFYITILTLPEILVQVAVRKVSSKCLDINPLNAELNPICHLLALLGVYFLHVSRIRVKSLTLRLLMSYIYIYIYGAPILDVSRSHTTTHHSR